MIHKLQLNRTNYYSRTTVGELLVDGKYFGYTLEDTCRPPGVKLYGETAIPVNPIDGYRIGIHRSNNLNREVLIIYTENDKKTLAYGGISFEYTYFHGMNTHEDTLGCIGIAKNHYDNSIQGSLEKELFKLVSGWIRDGEEVRLFINNNSQSK